MVQRLGSQTSFSSGEVAISYSAAHRQQARIGGVAELEEAIVTESGSIRKRGGTKFLYDLGTAPIIGVFEFENYVITVNAAEILIFLVDDDGARLAARINHNRDLSHLTLGYFPGQRVGNSIYIQGQTEIFSLLFISPAIPRDANGKLNLGQWVFSTITGNIERALRPYETRAAAVTIQPYRVGGTTLTISSPNLMLTDVRRRLSFLNLGDGCISSGPDSEGRYRVSLRGPAVTGATEATVVEGTRLFGPIGPVRPSPGNEADPNFNFGTERPNPGEFFLRSTRTQGVFTPAMESARGTYRHSEGDPGADTATYDGRVGAAGEIEFLRYIHASLFIVRNVRQATTFSGITHPFDAISGGSGSAIHLASVYVGNRKSGENLLSVLKDSVFAFYLEISVPAWRTTNTAYPNWTNIIGFHQNRLFFAANQEDRNKLWFSGTGDYEVFTQPMTSALDTAAFSLDLDPSEQITWTSSADFLFVGTNRGIYHFTHQDAFTLNQINIRKISSTGSKFIRAVAIGSRTYFVGAADSEIYVLFYTQMLRTYETRKITSTISDFFGDELSALEITRLDRHNENLVATTKLRDGTSGPLLYGTINLTSRTIAWSRWLSRSGPGASWGHYLATVYSTDKLYLIRSYATRYALEEYRPNSYLDLEFTVEVTVNGSQFADGVGDFYRTAMLNDHPDNQYIVSGDTAYNFRGEFPITSLLTPLRRAQLGIDGQTTKTLIFGFPINFTFTTLEPEFLVGEQYYQGSRKIYNVLEVLVNNTVSLQLGGLAFDSLRIARETVVSYYIGRTTAGGTDVGYVDLNSQSGYYKWINPLPVNDLGQLRFSLSKGNIIKYGPTEVCGLYYQFSSSDE